MPMASFELTDSLIRQFNEDGYILVERLFDAEEMELLRTIAQSDTEFTGGAVDRKDASGGLTRLAVSNDLGDDIYSAVVRCERVAGTMEKLLCDEIYHYHHKMTMKEPFTGGAWEWHQ